MTRPRNGWRGAADAGGQSELPAVAANGSRIQRFVSEVARGSDSDSSADWHLLSGPGRLRMLGSHVTCLHPRLAPELLVRWICPSRVLPGLTFAASPQTLQPASPKASRPEPDPSLSVLAKQLAIARFPWLAAFVAQIVFRFRLHWYHGRRRNSQGFRWRELQVCCDHRQCSQPGGVAE